MQRSILLVAFCLLPPAARADEVRLHDGRVLVGKVTERGGVLEIETRDGIVRVNRAEVANQRTDTELREDLRREAADKPDTPFHHLHLAARARGWGLETEMWQHLDKTVGLPRDAERQALRSRIDDFLAQLEPEVLPRRYRSADTTVRVRELLRRLERRAGAGLQAAVEELLVREPNADKELRSEARRGEPWRRLCALEALLRRGTKGNDTFLLRSAIVDPTAEVRTATMAIAQRYLEPETVVRYLAPGLMHELAEVRVRTAEAYGNLGSVSAVKLLVAAGPNAGRALAEADPGMRAHIAFVEQQSYIRDFDVEVAQASFIADPKIGVLQSGTVLDVTVHGAVTHRTRIVNAYRGALQRLAGADPGANPARWATWLLEREGNSPLVPPNTPDRGNGG
jgi:hypothetical protein